MSIEKFTVKEKLATDPQSQVAWLAQEMGYSRDKTHGYDEKLIRMARDPDHERSVFGFMGNYWHRARLLSQNATESPEGAALGLQAYAKVVAGLADKVALALWLQDAWKGQHRDHDSLLEEALGLIQDKVQQAPSQHSQDQLLSFIDEPFESNPMGQAVLQLHESYAENPADTQRLLDIALEGSVEGIAMWRAYSANIENHGIRPVMPKPGLSSGEIAVW